MPDMTERYRIFKLINAKASSGPSSGREVLGLEPYKVKRGIGDPLEQDSFDTKEDAEDVIRATKSFDEFVVLKTFKRLL